MTETHSWPERPVRVALFHPYRALLDGPHGGGGTYEESVTTIFDQLQERGFVEVVHLVPVERRGHSLPRTFRGSPVLGFRTTFFERWVAAQPDSILSSLIVRKGWLKLNQLLRKESIDLAYFSSPSHTALRLDDVPYIFTVWDLGHRDLPGFPEMSSHREWFSRENLCRVAIPRASHVMVDSPRTADRLQDLYGLDPERSSALGLLPRAEATLAPTSTLGGDYIIYPAARWPHKNHRTLFQAFAEVRRQYPELRLVLTGQDEGYGAVVQGQVEALGLRHAVIDLGLVSRSELLAHIEGARVLVMPTLLGPTNLPPLEALALGTPAVVSDVHEYGTEVDDLLVKVAAMDVAGWAEAIVQALAGGRRPPISFPLEPAIEEHARVLQQFVSPFAH